MNSFDKKRAIANHGDISRLSVMFKKLEDGQKVTICFLGGSITQGSLSSLPTTCYAYRVYEWFKDSFKNADIKYINAGVGGTTSAFGAARADRDVLSYEPDLVVVEFSVNDECNDYFKESYEGLIRKLIYSQCSPAVLCLYNFFYENGKSAEKIHSKVARYYDLPAVSMHGAIYQDILDGRIEDTLALSPDGLHPNDAGHELVSSVLIYFFEEIYKEYGEDKSRSIAEKEYFAAHLDIGRKAPITDNAFESALRLDNRNHTPVLKGFEKDDSHQECVSDCFKNGWLGHFCGDRIVFELGGEYECSGIAIQYDKTIKRPAPVVAVMIDGDVKNKVVIDSAFEETWGDLLDIRQLFIHEDKKAHKVEIEVIDDKGGKAVPFNLVSVIITR